MKIHNKCGTFNVIKKSEPDSILAQMLHEINCKYEQARLVEKIIGNSLNLASNLKQALNHPIWKKHERNKSVYYMDGKKDRWQIVYYPILIDGKTQEYYDEPRALVQNIDKCGFWNKEVPLRYLSVESGESEKEKLTDDIKIMDK